MSVRVAIAGVSGYTGSELFRLVSEHPSFEVAWVGGEKSAGKKLSEVLPWLSTSAPGRSEAGTKFDRLTVEPLSDIANAAKDVDLVFLALPAGIGGGIANEIAGVSQAKVVDLGPDFRLPQPLYERWYKRPHPAPALLEQGPDGAWIYGFTEALRDQIRKARFVANPGCFALASLIGLWPLARAGILSEASVIIDGKSGLSGAGRSAEQRLLLAEGFEDVCAYATAGHRHLPEITRFFSSECGGASSTSVTFVPHLVPMSRGLLVTCYVVGREIPPYEEVLDTYQTCYGQETFVQLVDEPPHTKGVRGTNSAALNVVVQETEGQRGIVVTVAIDNLGKGAAGSAVQNANLMAGLEEDCGLSRMALWP
jgi:N-acetyl-gamma-glutamyl-phosphate reductase